LGIFENNKKKPEIPIIQFNLIPNRLRWTKDQNLLQREGEIEVIPLFGERERG